MYDKVTVFSVFKNGKNTVFLLNIYTNTYKKI